jgi:hypothetical protein
MTFSEFEQFKELIRALAVAIVVSPQLEILDNESISASSKDLTHRRNSIRIENARKIVEEIF